MTTYPAPQPFALEVETVAESTNLLRVGSDALIVNGTGLSERPELFQRLNVALHGRLKDLALAGRVPEARGEIYVLDTPEAGIRSSRMILVAIGGEDGLDAVRAAIGLAIEASPYASIVAVALSTMPLAPEAATQAAVEAALLASYRFERFRTRRSNLTGQGLTRLVLIGGSQDAASHATVVTQASNRARDLQNLPPNVLGPEDLATRAKAIAETYPAVTADIYDEGWLRDHRMGAFLAVARGSSAGARMIVLRHTAARYASQRPVLGLIGKGITFDAGGFTLKPASGLVGMKFDMSGAAAVIEATAAIAELEVPLDVIAVVGAAENLPGATAYRPDDVVTASDGRTIEIRDTDSEGRLVLADCLTYAAACGATHLVDVATLTEAAQTALGDTHAALFGNDQSFVELVRDAGEASGEHVWQLPLNDRHRDLLFSQVADLVNQPDLRFAGASVAARFLQEFVGERPWVHLDIAGVASRTNEQPGLGATGGTGWGVRLLVEVTRRLASEGS